MVLRTGAGRGVAARRALDLVYQLDRIPRRESIFPTRADSRKKSEFPGFEVLHKYLDKFDCASQRRPLR